MTDEESGTSIDWTEPMFRRLKTRYDKAVMDGEKEFTFDGDVFVTDYAKWLIEYLETKFK